MNSSEGKKCSTGFTTTPTSTKAGHKVSKPPLLIVILGPTASGKTGAAIRLAEHYNTEIVSADSRQVFKELRIGSAMPEPHELEAVKHHMVAVRSVQQDYNVSLYENEALACIREIFSIRSNAILCGGSGLYIDAVCNGISLLPDPDPALREELRRRLREDGADSLLFELKRLDPEYYGQCDLKNPVRVIRALEVCISSGKPYSLLRKMKPGPREFRCLKIGILRNIRDLDLRIRERTHAMMAAGWLEEARALLPFRHVTALNTVGYKELFSYFDQEFTLDEAIEKIITNTRRYAKRQMTWFRKDADIHWVDEGDPEEIRKLINNNI